MCFQDQFFIMIFRFCTILGLRESAAIDGLGEAGYLFKVIVRLRSLVSVKLRMTEALTVTNISMASANSTSPSRHGTTSDMDPGGADKPG